ncbi:MAG: methionyl-tRNA formyltransferase [Planctomycetota bacterium]|jgi:methionyl-tRNA formyltransferase|nr:methionyl-tRNA formyltransferase [Planctomycetota bacterium]
MAALRIVFLGSGAFGGKTLETLVSSGRSPLAVVTRPKRPAGRGRGARATPIHALAEILGLAVLTPENPNAPEFAAELKRLAPDLGVVAAYGHLLRKPLLGVPPLGFVNLHASLLPAYRGAAPIPWAILNGEKESGVTIFQLNERFDAGAILAKRPLLLEPDDTTGSYLGKLASLGADLMARTLADMEADAVRPLPQDESLASPAPKLEKKDGRIDWRRSCVEIDRQVRAFQPWPLAYTFLVTARGEARINVLRLSRITDGVAGAKPGTLLSADPERGLTIMAGDRPVRIERLQPEGRRPMNDVDFLRGTRVPT